MNYLENSDTWKMIEATVTEYCKLHDLSKVEECTKQEQHCLIEKCMALAVYSPSRDDSKQIRQYELDEKENKGEWFSAHLFGRLEKHFFLKERILSCDLQAERKLLAGLRTHLPGNTYFPAEPERIRNLLEIGCALMSGAISLQDTDILIAKADAVKLLLSYGVKAELCEGRFDLSDAACKKIFDQIEAFVKDISGPAMMRYLYDNYLALRYIPPMDRFVISRGANFSEETADFPFRLLWNLSVKHYHSEPRISGSDNIRETISKTVELANAWLKAMGLHERTAIQYALMQASQFPLRLKEELLYDAFCVPEQYCSRYVLLLMDYLIKPWFDDYAKVEYRYRDLRNVAKYILESKGGCQLVNIAILKKRTGVSRRRLLMILNDFSWQMDELNHEYNDLTAGTNVTKRPLMRRSDTVFAYFDQHFCGIGFFLRAQELLTEHADGLDRQQGEKLEIALKEELKACGIPFCFGKVPDKGGMKESDCDLVFESERIIFAEIKKSGCSREFDIADDVGVLSRLGHGMLKAQKQCFHHECYLRKNGVIVLQDSNNGEHSLHLDEKTLPAIKISICMSEYSFLTNKSFSKTIMESLPYMTYHPYDSRRESAMTVFNSIREEILNYAHKDPESGLIRIEELRSYTLFCSMQQILMAAWIWKNAEDFFLMIRDWRQTADTWLDPYYLILRRLIVKENPEAMSVSEHALMMLRETHPESVFVF